jgi:hypothetical protein
MSRRERRSLRSLRLVTRREFRVPTLPGWGLVGLVCALALESLRRRVYPFLAQQAPVGSRLRVVEGWFPPDAIADAVGVFRGGEYDRFAVRGGPVEDGVCGPGHATWAERAGGLACRFGVREGELAVVPAPVTLQEATDRRAVSVRQWAEASGLAVEAPDVFSLGPHARRSRWLYQRAFGEGVAVGILAATPRSYGPGEPAAHERWGPPPAPAGAAALGPSSR